MVIKVGINGFGRIGRIVARAFLQNPDFQLSAINDPAISVEYICYLIKFDSTHGKMKETISHSDDEIVIDDQHIKVFHEKLPPSVPWNTAGVEYVVEASGMFTSLEKASGHLASKGVKRVIVTAPSVDVPMIILGVNNHQLSPEQKVVSCASSTLYCLAPIIKVLENNFGVEEGFITSIHAMTPSLKPLDGLCLRGRHWRDHRSIHQNIIPATTGACKALGKILPQVKDKLSGLAFRVPIVNVSVLDLTVRLNTHTTLQEIVKSVEKAKSSGLKNVITVSSEESVSSDFVGETHSCVFDEDSSIQLNPKFFKIICWYENEYSYACRVIDTIMFSEQQLYSIEIPTKVPNIRLKASMRQNILQQLTYRKNKMTILCQCKTEIDQNLISSSSEGTRLKISPSPRSLSIKKPSVTIPLLQGKETKRNELFKIWNDNAEVTKSKQNRSTFFQSCMAFSPQTRKKLDCNAEERLENVKREFSKMINITEDLLKKTQSNQSNSRSISVDELEKKGLNDNYSNAKRDVQNYMNNESNIAVHVCGDCKSLVDSSNTSLKLNHYCIEGSVTPYDKEIICDFENRNTGTEGDYEKLVNTENKEKLDSETFIIKEHKDALEILMENNCKLNTLIDDSAQNVQTTATTENENKICGNNIDLEQNSLQFISNDSRELDDIKNKEDAITHEISKHESNKDKNYIKVIDEEFRKRNIILVDNLFAAEETELDNVEHGNIINETGQNVKKMNLHKLEASDSCPGDVVTVSEDTSRCDTPENTITTVSNGVNEHKQDIYDKLDSASETDSNNSFEIKERQSQVIQIMDLTNSLEDLARLDKICRIIEISDELSDKLFAALDNNGCELKKKKWSFKDLCERIKLDDFCNTVFGKTRA